MPLESCMLVLDNSEYMRNGDFLPTRFGAQAQAVTAVFSAKTDSNPESAVGLMTMAGKSPSLLVTPTNDLGKLLSALGRAVIGGLSDLQTSIQVAQLALKHRENKNQRQRIVVFVGSPVEDTEENLVRLGNKLRKNNVLIDIVTFGEEGQANDAKLQALIKAAGDGESHMVSIPVSSDLLAESIQRSPILYDPEFDTGSAGGGGGGGGGSGEVDPEMDPELAMAIRMSLAEAQAAAGGSSTTAQADSSSSVNLPPSVTAPLSNANESKSAVAPASGDESAPLLQQDDEDEEDDEEEEMRRAMALSRGENPDDDVVMGEEEDDEEDEEAAMARAIAMSMEDSQPQDEKK